MLSANVHHTMTCMYHRIELFFSPFIQIFGRNFHVCVRFCLPTPIFVFLFFGFFVFLCIISYQLVHVHLFVCCPYLHNNNKYTQVSETNFRCIVKRRRTKVKKKAQRFTHYHYCCHCYPMTTTNCCCHCCCCCCC